MPYPAHFRSLAVVMAFALVVTLALFIPGASANDGDQPTAPEKPQLTYPNLSTHLNQLAEGSSSGLMAQGQAAGESPVNSGGSVAVTVYLDSHVSDVVEFLEDNGGDPRNVGTDYIEAYVPVDLLALLSQQPGVTRVMEIIPPQPAYGNVTSQAVGLHLADSWQNAGYQGQGVKVGVIDLELGGLTRLMGTELPSNVHVRCYTDYGVFTTNLSECEAVSPVPPSVAPHCRDYVSRLYQDNGHGTAVAEAIIDIAPEVTLYLAYPASPGDLQEITRWMEGEGVSVINHSVGWFYDGPGDGTSPTSDSPLRVVDQAVDGDITWLNSAGNNGDRTWFGSYHDPDGDGFLGFNSSNDEEVNFPFRECRSYRFQLRWEDSWEGASTDLDLYLYDAEDNILIPLSVDEQSGGSGHVPFEWGGFRALSDSDDFRIVVRYEGGPVPDWIQLTYWGTGSLEHATGSGSITNPAESANPGMLAVGAAPFYDINTIEPFSSQGPTPDGRIKPDIVGVDCAASVTYEFYNRRDNGQGCWFAGTSQASPHVAGLAALVRQRFPDFTAQQTAAYLKNTAETRGAVPNNTWGYGFAQLPATDVGDCLLELATDGATSGQWSPQCQSLASERGYSQYYTFTLEETAEVTVDLTSTVDPYLFLRSGDARSGDFLYENDDIQAMANRNSRITATLPAGAYTIEATTYDAGETGAFTLTISGLGGDGTGEAGATPDGCGTGITADGTTPGTWALACESQVPDRGYAQYYTFTLDQQSAVTIGLESSVDTYLYLRRGDLRTGTALYENDDIESGGVNLNSRISETLAAATYTIEAATYDDDEIGTFTLTISGLSGTTTDPDPDPDPESDACAATTITAADSPVTGAWVADCQSSVSGRGYAQYYTFTLDQQSALTIDLQSTVDPFLYLRRGTATSGTILHENDDVDRPGGNLNSQISQTLAAGTYTIEAATYDADETGAFTLTISGLSGATTDPDPDPGSDPDPETDACAATTITAADSPVTGAWVTACRSTVSGRGYAKYYTFTLDQQSAVTIDLQSTVDPFLYLRRGTATSGAALHENDDVDQPGGNYNSQISQTLAAGTYTIEAATYDGDETGAFTITISGLAGDEGGGEPETDACVDTLAVDGTTSGTWAAGCDSETPAPGSGSGARLARFYSFTLDQQSGVTIDLESDLDTFLYLRRGTATSGDTVAFNDDIEGGGVNLNSRISETLPADTYTIEATTYNAGDTGTFTLTITGLGGGSG